MAELDDIRSFIAVTETGGFGRAAQILGLSKSIVSRRVSKLEEELGARLLSRTTRGVSPTEAGIEFKARSERILAELEEAREAVAQQAGGVAGRLRIAMPLTFGNRHVVQGGPGVHLLTFRVGAGAVVHLANQFVEPILVLETL